jgi:hypothetical protein
MKRGIKRVKLEIPGKSLDKNLPATIILEGRIFIFYNGGMKIYTIINEDYRLSTHLFGRENRITDSYKHLSLKYNYGSINFFAYEWWIAERAKKGEILNEKEKEWNYHVKRTIKDAHIIIENGKFLKGSKKKLKEYGIKLMGG